MGKLFVLLVAAVALAGCGTDEVARPDACAAVEANPSYSLMLESGSGKTALGTIDFVPHPMHDNVKLMINAEPMMLSFDVIADPCTVDSNGNAVFKLHPPVAADPTQVDLKDGDVWIFSRPPHGPAEIYAIADVTGMFANPVTPGWTGHASAAPPAGEGLGTLFK